LTYDSLQSADKVQQESRSVAEKPLDLVVKFDACRHYSGIARFSMR